MMSLTLIGTHRCCGNISIMSLVSEHGKQSMPCYANFSVPLQTEILSTETSDFLKHKAELIEKITRLYVPYFLGYKMDFFPSKTIPKI